MKNGISRIFALLLCFMMCASLLIACGKSHDAVSEQPGEKQGENKQDTVTETREEPTCTESGYIARKNEATGTTTFEELPPAGHRFGAWTEDEEQQTKTHVCEVCGYKETFHISSIPENSIPQLSLTGSLEGIGKKQRVVLKAEFVSAEQSFQCNAVMTTQGHSTYGYPKTNYTVRFYDDTEGNQKHKLNFRNWNKEHKYILKANYVDLSQCRNLVGANLWTDMVRSRENVPDAISKLPTLGAVDGFPVSVVLNGEFFGLFTMNLHKDDDLYQMKEGKKNALVICNQQTADEALFLAPAEFAEDYSSDWEVEFCGTEDETWAKEGFNSLITFVNSSSDQVFREHLADYLDMDAAVDYLIFIYALGLQHSGAKDLVMLNFGDKWIPSAFDMDEAFGLDAEAYVYLAPDAFLPEKTDGIWSSGTGSLLWDRLLQNFEEQIRERYSDLRQGVLSEESLRERIHTYIAGIPESLYDYDYYLYPDRPVDDRNMEDQIIHYIAERLPILDQALES